MNKIASVAISGTTRNYDILYSYNIPEHLIHIARIGMRAMVPFGRANRSVEAYILNIIDTNGTGTAVELKDIKQLIDEEPLLNEAMIKLCEWMRKRYICTYWDAIKSMLPPGIGMKSIEIISLLKYENSLTGTRKEILDFLIERGNECEFDELKEAIASRTIRSSLKALHSAGLINIREEYSSLVKQKFMKFACLARPADEIISEIESNRIKHIQHIRILEMLIENEYISASDIKRAFGVSAGVLDTLAKHGYIELVDMEVNRDPVKDRVFEDTPVLKLSTEQEAVLAEAGKSIDGNEFSEILIHGVTGSGKTEVYMNLIQKVIGRDKEAIVLVPEISLTPQMVDRFKGRFGSEVAVLHSRLSLGERYDQWRLARDGKVKVVVGARSAVFAPFKNIGVIIMDEEHETSYKSETTPKYHARDIARQRCMNDNAVVIYGSATPSVENYYKAVNSNIKLLEMHTRANNMIMPRVDVIDMRKELEDGNRTMFSNHLKEEIRRNIELGQQTMLFLNRRGYSSFVMCRECGLVLKCINCNVSMTYHSHDDRLICHYCGFTTKNPHSCPKCGSKYIRQFGAGTQKVEDEIKLCFPDCSTIRMDMDTTGGKNSHERILNAFRNENINIMIGTQMIAKGHDFPNVTLVGVIAADTLLNTGDYYSSERAFQLITQVAGRSGRGSLPGRVIIQTYNTDDFSIKAACRYDYAAFYSQEIKLRHKLMYPPFINIVAVVLNGIDDRAVFEASRKFKIKTIDLVKKYDVKAEVLGPARSPITKIKSKYRWRIIIKCEIMDKIIYIMTILNDMFKGRKSKNEVELSIDINPLNML